MNAENFEITKLKRAFPHLPWFELFVMWQWEASSSPPEIPVVSHDATLAELTPTALQAYL